MPVFTDQTGNIIELHTFPQRIISIVPSQTELLHDLGLEDEVIGITKFCVHPAAWFQNKTKVGGTKQLHLDKIRQLQPHLIIANKEENTREQVEELQKDFPVWISDIHTLDEALHMIRELGRITDTAEKAGMINKNILHNFSSLTVQYPRLRCAYLIWQKPYMAAGGDTFIHAMMEKAGLENVFADLLRYPEITIGMIQASGCEYLLLSSEPFPFAEKHVLQLQALLPSIKIVLVDGEMFSWYGSRLLGFPQYCKSLFLDKR
ncbi:MAG TPA: helical backbone metal receptor [Chitinophagaceae bacterium]